MTLDPQHFLEKYYRLAYSSKVYMRKGSPPTIVLYPRDNTFRIELHNLPQAIKRDSFSILGGFHDLVGI